VSQNARNHGGYVPVNLVEALATHAMTPEQALRKVMLQQTRADKNNHKNNNNNNNNNNS